ncbi:HSF-type DNA-binding domain-containing protein [Ditylenchus destructor]|uniref:HSF-type DNA-binding domain-containing protein n=1 Tax=Ditylenchus destructor TaxID=166010 RepID=A0AAD4NB91_9BILA|nr:HSF-type DNA-binding domain-containing protein [Ditylenchus destructor]
MDESKLTNFLVKIWSILEDDSIADTICWDRSGMSFHIYDLYKFCEVVLPRFFKHKNMSSFVRQLNLYGFKKIAAVDRSVLSYSDNLTDHMQFYHPLFRQGQPELLNQIKRNNKRPANSVPNAPVAVKNSVDPNTGEKLVTLPESDLICMLEELESLRGSHSHMQSAIFELTHDNELLWNEVGLLRDQHLKQQQNVGKLVQFLISLMQPASGSHCAQQKHGRMAGMKRFVQIGESDPLALTSPMHQKQSWDILSCIQQDILSEALHYSSASSFSPPSGQEAGRVAQAPTPPGPSDVKFKRPEIIRSTNKFCFPHEHKESMASPRHQLSMHLTTSQHSQLYNDRSAVVPFSSAHKVNIANHKQLMHPSAGFMRMGNYQLPSKIESQSDSGNESCSSGSALMLTSISRQGQSSHEYDEHDENCQNESNLECLQNSVEHDYAHGDDFGVYSQEDFEMMAGPSNSMVHADIDLDTAAFEDFMDQSEQAHDPEQYSLQLMPFDSHNAPSGSMGNVQQDLILHSSAKGTENKWSVSA